jgi:hypothetical protein
MLSFSYCGQLWSQSGSHYAMPFLPGYRRSRRKGTKSSLSGSYCVPLVQTFLPAIKYKNRLLEKNNSAEFNFTTKCQKLF